MQLFLQKTARAKWTRIHFFGSYESSHDTNSIFLQAKNAQVRTNSNFGKLNVSKNGSPIFYKRKRYTKVLFNKMFFPKNGSKRFALAWALRAHPHFSEKNSIKKNCCVSFEVCKKWHCRFFEASDLLQYEYVRAWAFLACKKIEIRVMWTFTASKKENPCSFLRVRSSAEKLHAFSEVFLSCENIKDLLKGTPII